MDEAWGQLVRGSGMPQNSDTTGGELVQRHSVDAGRREMAQKVDREEKLICRFSLPLRAPSCLQDSRNMLLRVRLRVFMLASHHPSPLPVRGPPCDVRALLL